jgi:hypothetical protein
MRWPVLAPLCLAASLVSGSLVVIGQPAPTPPAAPASGRLFAGLAEERILEAVRTGRILGRQNVGSTSVNYHLHLAGDIDAAFKPRSSSHGERYRAEIAAFRLNRLLGLNRVPPAISRSVPAAQLRLAPDTLVLAERDNTVRGAAIYWVPVLRDSMIDRPREIDRWSGWLRQGNSIPADQQVRAEEISTLVVFDALTGNWDRWSGANVPMDTTGHLVYRDNNGGFEEPFVEGLNNRVLSWLRRVQKFSRPVIDRARALTEASIRAEMALDPDRTYPPLTDSQIRSLLRRRDQLVTYVDGLAARHGQAVYAW